MRVGYLYKAWVAVGALAAGWSGVSAQTCEPYWSGGFTPNELNSTVRALGVFDDGSGNGSALYVGGSFTTLDDLTVNRIVRLDDSGWSPLGSGVDNSVLAIKGFDDGSGMGPALYVGGIFTTAGGVAANRIARWDGSAWSALDTGLDGAVFALVVFDDRSGPALYAGGHFARAGDVPANSIARWDGVAWSTLGTGMDGWVRAIAVFDDGSGEGAALYAAGDFTMAGGTAAKGMARWNGTSWSPVGGGMDDFVAALAAFDDGSGQGPALYAGGYFTEVDGIGANRIAKWDGGRWLPLAEGLDGPVLALAAFEDGQGEGVALHAAGSFTAAGGVTAKNIAKWDGSSWSPLENGIEGTVNELAVFDDGSAQGPALWTGGYFSSAGDTQARHLAKWDGAAWSGVGGGISGYYPYVLATISDDDRSTLYVSGDFTTAGGIAANGIASWNGKDWSSLGSGLEGDDPRYVSALALFDDGLGEALYAGGFFDIAGGKAVSNIARWDGTSWSEVGGGISSWVRALAVFDVGSGEGPALYAAGLFGSAGGAPAARIAKWNGSTWSPLGDGLSGPDSVMVRALAVYDDGTGLALYAGGVFAMAGNVRANGIARWDGATWSPLGEGIHGDSVWALAVYDDGSGAGPALYVGGRFAEVGDDISALGIGKWDGSSWSPVGQGLGLYGFAASLHAFDDGLDDRPALYVGGSFTMAGQVVTRSIARWNGESWSALGDGMGGGQSTVTAMTVFDDDSGTGPALLVGGNFTTAGGISSQNIAKWVVCATLIGDLDGDGDVDEADLDLLLASWGACPDEPDSCPADLDTDGTVDVTDLLILLANWG